jgi:hypothetical protein
LSPLTRTTHLPSSGAPAPVTSVRSRIVPLHARVVVSSTAMAVPDLATIRCLLAPSSTAKTWSWPAPTVKSPS